MATSPTGRSASRTSSSSPTTPFARRSARGWRPTTSSPVCGHVRRTASRRRRGCRSTRCTPSGGASVSSRCSCTRAHGVERPRSTLAPTWSGFVRAAPIGCAARAGAGARVLAPGNRRHKLLVPTLLAVAAQVGVVVPENAQAAAVAAALGGDVEDRRAGGVASEPHRRQHCAVHDLKRHLPEIQGPALLEIEDAIRMAGACAEADDLRIRQRGVVGEPGRLPVAPSLWVRPAQEMLPPTPVILLHSLGVGDAQEARELLARTCRVAVAAEARMQPELVAAPREVAEQPTHRRVLVEVGADARAPVAMREEGECAAQPVTLADVHQEFVGVVWIEAEVAQRAKPTYC